MTIPRSIPSPGSRGRIVAALLVGVVAILATVTVALYLTQRAPNSSPTSAPAPAESSPAATTPHPDVNTNAAEQGHSDDDDHDVADGDRASWEPVVLGFAKNFTDTSGGPGRWRTRLSPYAVPAVRDQLATVDPEKVPAGHFDSYEVLTPGSYQIAVKVTYREGWALVLYLTTDGAAWSITNYDRYVE